MVEFVVAEPLAFGTPVVVDVTVATFVIEPVVVVVALIVNVTDEPEAIDVIVLEMPVGKAVTVPHVAVPFATQEAVVKDKPVGAGSEKPATVMEPDPEKATTTLYVTEPPTITEAGPVFVTVITPV